MKLFNRIFWTVIAVLSVLVYSIPLAVDIAYAQDLARMNVGVLGGGVSAAACGQTDIYETGIDDSRALAPAPNNETCGATTFTAAGSGTYLIKSFYIWGKRGGETAPTGNVLGYMCTITCTESNCKPNVCTAFSDATVANSTFANGVYGWRGPFVNTTGYSVDNGTKYAIAVCNDGAGSNYPQWGTDSASGPAGQELSYAPTYDGTWTITDNDGQAYFKASSCTE